MSRPIEKRAIEINPDTVRPYRLFTYRGKKMVPIRWRCYAYHFTAMEGVAKEFIWIKTRRATIEVIDVTNQRLVATYTDTINAALYATPRGEGEGG